MPPIVEPTTGIRSTSATKIASSRAYGTLNATSQANVTTPVITEIARLPNT